MDAVRTVAPGAGEIIGDAADRRVEILAETEALHATWSRFGPGRDGADRHIHRHHTDFFYVLSGELTVKLAEGEAAAPAGALAIAPPLAVHGFRNGAGADVRYLNLHAPGCGFADYMRGLRDGRPVAFDQEDPPAGEPPPPDEVIVTAGERAAAAAGVAVTSLADGDPIGVARLDLDPGASVTPELTAAYVLAGEVRLGAAGAAPAGTWLEPAARSAVALTGGEGSAAVLVIDAR